MTENKLISHFLFVVEIKIQCIPLYAAKKSFMVWVQKCVQYDDPRRSQMMMMMESTFIFKACQILMQELADHLYDEASL